MNSDHKGAVKDFDSRYQLLLFSLTITAEDGFISSNFYELLLFGRAIVGIASAGADDQSELERSLR